MSKYVVNHHLDVIIYQRTYQEKVGNTFFHHDVFQTPICMAAVSEERFFVAKILFCIVIHQ